MKLLNGILFVLLLLCFSAAAQAQTGALRGNVMETFAGKTEPIIGAVVNIEGTSRSAVTDTAGHFYMDNVPVGTYNIRISYIGYEPRTVKGVEIKDGQTANLPKVTMSEDPASTTQEVEIIGTRDKGSDVSMIQEIKTLDVVASGISSEQIKRTMDRDAADVAARVAGVTVVDNRFVIVRGLSERYNAVMLNDVLAPSFEQDVKSFSLDNIRSNFIDRMIVYKSPSADLPGDFAGGVVKIYTLGMPVKNGFSVGFSSSYRQGTTFQDFKRLPEGKTAWLGYDDGMYAYPKNTPPDFNTSGGSTKYDVYKVGALFPNNAWTARESVADPDIRFSLNNNYRLKLGGTKVLGIVSGVNYSNVYEKWSDSRQSLFVASQPRENYTGPLQRQLVNADILDVNARSIRLSALQNFIFQLNGSNSIEWKNLYSHVGVNRYRNAYRYNVSPEAYKDNPASAGYMGDVGIANSYGGIFTSHLSGKSTIRKNTEVNWNVSYARAERNEPDIKNYSYSFTNAGGYVYNNTGTAASPVNFGRFFFKTQEDVRTVSTDITHRKVFDLFGQTELSLKGGWYLENKNRSFGARTFGYRYDYNKIKMNIPPSDFSKDSTWNNSKGFAIDGQLQTGAYTANTDLYSFYGMVKLAFSEKLNVSGGMRLENYTRIILGRQLYLQNWLPSANISYNLSKKWILRGSYGKTINRPELREATDFQTYDFYLRTMVNGNSKLRPSDITNYDFRIEFYPSSEQAFTLGVFYKEFKNPIERIIIQPVQQYLALQWFDLSFINAEMGYSKGIEAEARTTFKDILIIKERDLLKNFSLIFNGSLLQSRIVYDMDKITESGVRGLDRGLTDAETLKQNLAWMRASNNKRSLLDQSPYMINAGLTYKNDQYKNQLNLSYNIYGRRLFAIIPGVAAIYEVPRHVLDLTFIQSIGKYVEVKFGIQDIFNQKIQFVQDLQGNGKVSRMKGTGYVTELSDDKSIYQNNNGEPASTIVSSPAPENPQKNYTYDVYQTEFLGFKRGTYYTLGVNLKF